MQPPLSRRKHLLFGVLAALLGVLVFFSSLEGVLRISGYGHHEKFHRTIRDAEGRRWVRENRDFTLTYFPPALVRRPQPFRLAREKPPGTYRIFLLGSSAAMGDPEPSFSLARTLEAMLRAAYPDLRVEVINAGITAINSHVVREIARNCAELEPDLFVVYEGNNEVIGPFGPAAVFSPFLRSSSAIRTSIAVKRTRLGQLIGGIARKLRAENEDPLAWGGMGMFLQHAIPVDDPRLDSVRDRFAENLGTIADLGREAGAHVLLCTVLTNQKDFAPFLSHHRTGLSQDELRRWQASFAAGTSAETNGNATEAETHYRAAWAVDDQHAELAFRLGQLCLARNRDQEAGGFFQRALDTDALRFRTDSRLNTTIRNVASVHAEAAELVDIAASLARSSPHGILGDETLYEHVHLTFRGTWQVARILFQRTSQDLLRRSLIAAAVAEPISYDEARTRLAYTTYEQFMIFQELLQRFSAPPFTGQSDHAARLKIWRDRADAALRLLQRPDSRDGLEASYQHAFTLAPDDWVLQRNFGMMLVSLGAPADGIPWLERAHARIDDDSDTLFALGSALHATQREAEAAAVFTALRKLEPRYPGLPGE